MWLPARRLNVGRFVWPKDGRTHTKGIWFYDLRTNQHFTLKTRPLRLEDLRDFIASYNPARFTPVKSGSRGQSHTMANP